MDTQGNLSTPRRSTTLYPSSRPSTPSCHVCLVSKDSTNKTMSSSLGESNRRMMVRSSPNLFWNGVPDRIICFLVQSSARDFRISLFGRPLLKFVPKSELSYQGLHSKTTLENFVRTIMPRLLPANDEAMDFFNTLTQGNLSTRLGVPRPSTPRRPSTLEPSATLDPSVTLDPLP